MKTGFAWMGAAVAALGILGFTNTAAASSHREAPAISQDPAADNTDFWAWWSGTAGAGTVHFVAAYNPMEEPAGGPNFHKFADDVLYEIHVGRGDVLDDVVTYQFRFTTTYPAAQETGPTPFATTNAVPPDPVVPPSTYNLTGLEFFSQISGQSQTYTVTKVTYSGGTPTATVITTAPVPVAPPNIGPRTDAAVYAVLFPNGGTPYSDAWVGANFVSTATSNGASVFAGPRDDGFYADLGGIFDLANLRAQTGTGAAQAVDNLAGYNTHAIALDVPDTDIPAAVDTASADPNLLATWASASRRKVRILRNDGSTQGAGPWVQVSRLGIPLINEAVIGLQDKDKYNRTTPKTDLVNFAGYFLNPTIVRDAHSVGILTDAQWNAEKTGRLDIVEAITVSTTVPVAADSIGDVLRVTIGTPSVFPDGRVVGNGTAANQDQANVTDVELSLLLLGATSGIQNGAESNDKPYLPTFPYLAGPWEGYTNGHGKPTTP